MNLFLARCHEAYDLVNGFLEAPISAGTTSGRKTGYQCRPELRAVVKQKVEKSLAVLETAIENHGYVLWEHLGVNVKEAFERDQFGVF